MTVYAILDTAGTTIITTYARPQDPSLNAQELDDADPRVIAYNAGETVPLLTAYVDMTRDRVALGGFAFNVGTTDAPIIVNADTNDSGRIDLAGLVNLVGLNANFTTVWDQAPDGIPLNGRQIVALGIAVGTFRSAVFAVASQLKANIVAGTVTTTAEIDAGPWPAAQG